MKQGLLTQQQKDAVETAITEAEKKTSGEIVTLIVRRSDTYPGARWRAAILFSLLCAFLLYWFLPELDGVWYLYAQLPALGLGWLLGQWAPVQRLFLLDDKVAEEVHQRALQEFHSRKLHSTRERTGVLILVSMLEHQVEILADSGITEKVKPEIWSEVIEHLIARTRAGDISEGLVTAIAECGEILAKHFPAQPGDRNELGNHLLIET